MKLFLLTQPPSSRYDTFDCCVVCAESAEAAKLIHPSGLLVWHGDDWWWDEKRFPSEPANDQSWTSPDKVFVTYLGEATSDLSSGVVLASLHAG